MLHIKKNDELKKILLVMCPTWGINIPPLGLAYLYAYLKAKKHLPEILDINIEMYSSSSKEAKLLWQDMNNMYWGGARFL